MQSPICKPRRAHGAAAVRHVHALWRVDDGFRVSEFLSLTSRGDLGAMDTLKVKAFREGDAEFWTAYLEAAREWQAKVDSYRINGADARRWLLGPGTFDRVECSISRA